MSPKDWVDFVRIIYSGPAGPLAPGNPNVGMRVHLQQGDPRVDKVEFARDYTRIDFDLDDRTEMGKLVQEHRVDCVERMLEAVFEAGVNEGRRRICEVLKETIGI